jgi:hypothetical protein
VWVVRLDTAHQIKWQKRYGSHGPDRAIGYLRFNDNKVLVAAEADSAGFTQFQMRHYRDIALMYLDSLGAIISGSSFGGSGDEEKPLQQMYLKRSGDYVVGGVTSGSADGDVGYNFDLPWTIKEDLWHFVVDTNLNFVQGYVLGSVGTDRLSTGTVVGSQIIGVGEPQAQPPGMPTVFPEPFIAWMYAIDINVASPTLAANDLVVNVFPNPTGDAVRLQWNGAVNKGLVNVCDLNGRVLSTKPFNTDMHTTTIDVSQFAAGLYLVKLTDTSGRTLALTKLAVNR